MSWTLDSSGRELLRLDGAAGAGVLYLGLTTPFGTASRKIVRVQR